MAYLKPCPFCGSEAVMETFTTAMEKVPRYRVRCTSCSIQTDWDLWSEKEASEAWNRRGEETLPQPDGEVECVMCGETFTETDLTELREMGEVYHREKGCFLCPDCWDSFQRMDPEEQVKMALINGWKEAAHEK